MGEVQCETRQAAGGGPTVRWVLAGNIGEDDRPHLRRAWRAYAQASRRYPGPPGLHVDLARVGDISEMGCLAIIEQLDLAKSSGARVSFRPARNPWRYPLARLWVHLKRLRGEEVRAPPAPVRGFVEALGAAAIGHLAALRQSSAFVGAVAAWTGRALLRRQARLWLFWDVAVRAGVDALPILTVLSFLVGVVLADQGSRQLESFGAEVFVANLVTIAFVREMGPLVTAILVAGRTGSAFTAALASMQDSEELHALQMMGHHPIGYLVVPRVLAAVACMPVLVLWSMFVGLFGAFVYSMVALDLRPLDYWTRTVGAVGHWDFLLALLKSLTFGAIIALVGCYKGLQEVKGADEVGRQTTASVVWCIFLVIVSSSAWTVFFSVLGR